jgi:hypothetical protein
MILGSRLGVVFRGQRQQAVMGEGVAGRICEAAASLGLLSEENGLRHRTLTQRRESIFGLSAAGALKVLAGNARL